MMVVLIDKYYHYNNDIIMDDIDIIIVIDNNTAITENTRAVFLVCISLSMKFPLWFHVSVLLFMVMYSTHVTKYHRS